MADMFPKYSSWRRKNVELPAESPLDLGVLRAGHVPVGGGQQVGELVGIVDVPLVQGEMATQ